MQALIDKKAALEELLNELKLSGHPVLVKKAKAYAKQYTPTPTPTPVANTSIELLVVLATLIKKIRGFKYKNLNFDTLNDLSTDLADLKVQVEAATADIGLAKEVKSKVVQEVKLAQKPKKMMT